MNDGLTVEVNAAKEGRFVLVQDFARAFNLRYKAA